jgi:uncharacterized Ntn-hydrolase superfamily protein
MTWSIVARDEETGTLAVGAATRFFAVGARVPFVATGVGAIATQALVNPYYGIDGLTLLRGGRSPEEVLNYLLREDPGSAHRQVHMIDAAGRCAAHTGLDCQGWSGHFSAHGVSVAGNMVTGPQVLAETLAVYLMNPGLTFQRRLINAMMAGEAAGGDRRGRQSASLILVGADEWSVLDLRVDDHVNPIIELARLEEVSRKEWMSYRRFVPTRSNPEGVTDHSIIDATVGAAAEEI